MTYFQNCETVEAVKIEYRKLAKRLHPDIAGGDGEAFKTMGSAYHAKLKSLNGQASTGDDGRERVYKYDGPLESKLVEICDELLAINPSYDILIVGLWLWVGCEKGQQQPLKDRGFFWNRTRQVWQYNGSGFKSRPSKHGAHVIAAQYGAHKYDNPAEKHKALAS